MNLQLKDRADVFYRRQDGSDRAIDRVTIERPDRPGDSRTYDLSTRTPASRDRLARLLRQDWPTCQPTPAGWMGLSSLDIRHPSATPGSERDR